jgi:RND family efflux transporter MFP subunit
MFRISFIALGVAFGLGAVPVCAAESPFTADVTTCLVKPKQVIQLGSSVFGVLAKLMVDRADTVTQGQVVGKLDTSVEEAQLALDRYRATSTTQVEAAKADLVWNMRELARRQKLASNMWSKINDVDESATKVEQDKIAIHKAEDDLKIAELEAARSEAQYNLKLIRSPVNGVVSDIKLMPGEFIYETTPIMTVAQIDPLNVELVVPAERYRSVKSGMTVELRLLPPVDLTVHARVDVIDPLIDAASNTFRVRLALPNPGNVIPAGVRCTADLTARLDE